MLSTDIGQSAHLRTVPSDRLRQVLSDLRIGPQTTIDPDTLQPRGGVQQCGRCRFRAVRALRRPDRDRRHDPRPEARPERAGEGAGAGEGSAGRNRLVSPMRCGKNLSLSPDVMKELKAQSFKPNSASIDALRDYNEGLALMREGKNLDALKRFQSATT